MEQALYGNLKLALAKGRPFFFSNFVMTVDGKVAITTNPHAYWPIGSTTDHATMYNLRAHADVLMHGSTTALSHRALNALTKPDFQKQRGALGKDPVLRYAVITANDTAKLLPQLNAAINPKPILFTTPATTITDEVAPFVEVVPTGEDQADLAAISGWLWSHGYHHVLVEGGPHVLAEFLAKDLLDEMFITIAPKIFGNDKHAAITMVEGHLFEPDKIKHLQLISHQAIKDEVYLHYRMTR